MIMQLLGLLAVLHIAKGDNKIKEESKKMMGLNTLHNTDITVDKDTIITRNMNSLKVTKRRKSSYKEEKPDWSYSSFPEEVQSHVADFKRNMSECLKEVQTSDKRPVKRLSPNKESPVHGECLIACVLKRNGVIERGKVNKGNLLTLVRKFYAKDEKLIKKLEKHLDRCIEKSVRSKDDCMVAARLNECTNGLMATSKHQLTVNY
ncbi:jg16916 [Pararge aegeria aegeria]|uniref:Jg16916 protein n=1 Tax=Pararge aegeria aegeria TaxID=348720 RepID=A0A8S4SHW3_9NEOP|nr:jg16916 [Pararge aegeria aegeria]